MVLFACPAVDISGRHLDGALAPLFINFNFGAAAPRQQFSLISVEEKYKRSRCQHLVQDEAMHRESFYLELPDIMQWKLSSATKLDDFSVAEYGSLPVVLHNLKANFRQLIFNFSTSVCM